MFKHHLPPVIHPEGGMKIETQLNYDYLAESTEGYTGKSCKNDITCKMLGCVHHRSLPTRKSKNRKIGLLFSMIIAT